MAAGYNLGKASITIVPVMGGAVRDIGASLGSAVTSAGGQVDAAGRGLGSRLGSSITSSLKATAKIGGVITGLVAGVTVKGGLDRALGLENAQAKMRGLGYDTKTVSSIMDNALASVEGTSFGLDAAATTAAGAVAAGIKPGEQLTGVLKTVANTAAATGGTMDEVGAIFNTVAATGTAYTGDIQMLAQRGIPMWQSLSKTLGVTVDEVKDMASKGKIDFATFEAAAKDASGGVATAMGDTTTGAFQNMMASVRKLGAVFMTGVLPLAKTAFEGVQGLLNAVKAKIEPFVQGFVERFGGQAQSGIQGFFDTLIQGVEAFDPQPLIDFFTTTDTSGGGFFNEVKGGILAFASAWKANTGDVTSSGFPGFMERAAFAVRQLWDQLKAIDFSSFKDFGASIQGMDFSGSKGAFSGIGSGLQEVAKASPAVLSIGLQALGKSLDFMGRHADLIVKLLPLIGAGLVLWRVNSQATTQALIAQRTATAAMAPVMAYNNTLNLINNMIEGNVAKSKIATMVATKAQTAATWLSTAATKAWGLAMKVALGPIGWVIAGITLLVGALVWFFTKTETGQALWARIWGGIKAVTAGVVAWFTGTVVPALVGVWTAIVDGAKGLWEAHLKPVFDAVMSGIMGVVGWFTGTLVPLFQNIWSMLTGGGFTGGGGVQEDSPIVGFFLGIHDAVVGLVTFFQSTVIPAFQAAFAAIGAAAMWLWQSVLQPVWEGIKIAVALVVAAVMTYFQAVVWYWQNILAPVAMWLYQSVILPVWNAIKTAIAVVVAAVMTYVQALVWYWQNILAPAALWLYNAVILPAWNGIKTAIGAVVTWFQTVAWPALKAAWDAVAAAAMWLWQMVLVPVWNGIRAVISAVVTWFQTVAWPIVKFVIDAMAFAFQAFKTGLAVVWAFIRDNVIAPVVNWFQNTVWPMVSATIDNIKRGFDVMKDAIGRAWSWVKDTAINPVVNWFQNTVKPAIDTVTGGIKTAFDTMKDGIGKAWDAVKNAAKEPVRFVIDTVLNNGLIANFNKIADKVGVKALPNVKVDGFARGGILPGWSRERDGDDQLVPMRRGEGVLVSEGLRDSASRALFMAANAAARRGRSFANFMAGGYASGGIVGGFKSGGILDKAKRGASGVWDWIADGVDLATEVLADPAAALKKLIQGSIDLIPGAGVIKDAAASIPGKIIDGIASSIKSVAQAAPAAAAGGGGGPIGPTGSGGSLGAAEALSRQFGLVVTSRGRRGARTAQNGLVSLHALGRALDIAGSPGQMMAFFNAADRAFSPTELLYSPAGARNKHRSGRRGPNTGATLRNHYSHVHIGFAKGGILGGARFQSPAIDAFTGGSIVPKLYDTGGVVDTGYTPIVNKTRKPEALLTNAQWMDASRAIAHVTDQRTMPSMVINGGTFGHDPEAMGRALRDEERKRAALYVY